MGKHLCAIILKPDKKHTMSKTIVVTGAAGNLGKTVVHQLANEGYKIIATLNAGAAPDYFETLGIESHVIDLLDESAVDQFAADILQRYPNLDGAVYLAGGFAPGGIAKASGADLDKMINLNFKTAFFLSQRLFTHFSGQSNGGRFVFIGARPGLVAADAKDLFAYGMSKSLIFRLAECINEAGKGHRINATVIVPSTIDTPANRAAMPDADATRWVKAEDLSAAISFALSDAGKSLRDSVLKMYNEA